VAVVGVLVALLLPTVQAARLMASVNNMKRIVIAIHEHVNQNEGYFPAHANYSDDGIPLLSWRIHILRTWKSMHCTISFTSTNQKTSESNISLRKSAEADSPGRTRFSVRERTRGLQSMTKPIRKITRSANKVYQGKHRFEHWLIDNQVYFITARCRDRFPAFATEAAKDVFWKQLDHYTSKHGFTPWVTSLLDNHYHTIGYLRKGDELPKMMQRIHGSVAKLVNDLLDEPWPKFWRDTKGREYFDGRIRDEKQGRYAYRYTMEQGSGMRLSAIGASIRAYARECGIGEGDRAGQ